MKRIISFFILFLVLWFNNTNALNIEKLPFSNQYELMDSSEVMEKYWTNWPWRNFFHYSYPSFDNDNFEIISIENNYSILEDKDILNRFHNSLPEFLLFLKSKMNNKTLKKLVNSWEINIVNNGTLFAYDTLFSTNYSYFWDSFVEIKQNISLMNRNNSSKISFKIEPFDDNIFWWKKGYSVWNWVSLLNIFSKTFDYHNLKLILDDWTEIIPTKSYYLKENKVNYFLYNSSKELENHSKNAFSVFPYYEFNFDLKKYSDDKINFTIKYDITWNFKNKSWVFVWKLKDKYVIKKDSN